jgi:hypothetical protein
MDKISHLEQKFGKSGRKGDVGEKWLYKRLFKFYDKVNDLRKDMDAQTRGIDFQVKQKTWKRFYSIDAKTNLERSSGKDWKIYLEWTKDDGSIGWFLKSEADRIYHINVTQNTSFFYDLKEMRGRVAVLISKGLLSIKQKKATKGGSYVMFAYNDAQLSDLIRTQY